MDRPLAAALKSGRSSETPAVSQVNLPEISARDAGNHPAKFVVEWVDQLLRSAIALRASDIHLTPNESALMVAFRKDGILTEVGTLPKDVAPNVVARLKVLAGLLSYHTEIPQEGRLRWSDVAIEMRFSTFPTVYGERGVVRLFIGAASYRQLDDLGLPVDLSETLRSQLRETSGVLLVCGPAGSGKTTTAYAAIRDLRHAAARGKCLISLEDPVEAVLTGMTQSQVNTATGFTYGVGLRSLMRQDPDVILVGEIRDRETAETVFQAGLTGHLVISTFHAGNSAEAVSRLCEMGVQPYVIRSSLLGILCQRLVRRVCVCGQWTHEAARLLELPVQRARVATGCDACQGTGYSGRMLMAEWLELQSAEVVAAVLDRSDAAAIRRFAVRSGQVTLGQRGVEAVQAGLTTPAEIRRVFGFRPWETV